MKTYSVLFVLYALFAFVNIFLFGFQVFVSVIGVLSMLFIAMIYLDNKHKLDKAKTLNAASAPLLIYPLVYVILVVIQFGFDIIVFIAIMFFIINVYLFIYNRGRMYGGKKK